MSVLQTEDDLEGLLLGGPGGDGVHFSPNTSPRVTFNKEGDKSLSLILDTQCGESHLLGCNDCSQVKKEMLKMKSSQAIKQHELQSLMKKNSDLEEQNKHYKRIVDGLKADLDHMRQSSLKAGDGKGETSSQFESLSTHCDKLRTENIRLEKRICSLRRHLNLTPRKRI